MQASGPRLCVRKKINMQKSLLLQAAAHNWALLLPNDDGMGYRDAGCSATSICLFSFGYLGDERSDHFRMSSLPECRIATTLNKTPGEKHV
jgi:hypothetical protein